MDKWNTMGTPSKKQKRKKENDRNHPGRKEDHQAHYLREKPGGMVAALLSAKGRER